MKEYRISFRMKLTRMRTTSAASTATSVPDAIAMPMSAWARAGESFTPSPTIATWNKIKTLYLWRLISFKPLFVWTTIVLLFFLQFVLRQLQPKKSPTAKQRGEYGELITSYLPMFLLPPLISNPYNPSPLQRAQHNRTHSLKSHKIFDQCAAMLRSFFLTTTTTTTFWMNLHTWHATQSWRSWTDSFICRCPTRNKKTAKERSY